MGTNQVIRGFELCIPTHPHLLLWGGERGWGLNQWPVANEFINYDCNEV